MNASKYMVVLFSAIFSFFGGSLSASAQERVESTRWAMGIVVGGTPLDYWETTVAVTNTQPATRYFRKDYYDGFYSDFSAIENGRQLRPFENELVEVSSGCTVTFKLTGSKRTTGRMHLDGGVNDLEWVKGIVTQTHYVGGYLIEEYSFPIVKPGMEFEFRVVANEGVESAFSIVNTQIFPISAQSLRLSLHDPAGECVAETTLRPFRSGDHVEMFLHELFQGVPGFEDLKDAKGRLRLKGYKLKLTGGSPFSAVKIDYIF